LRSIGGMWTSGGNMSNHVAIAVALASALPEVRVNGLVDISERPVVVLASGVEHFSYLGAAQVMGLGSAGMLWTAPTEDHTSDVDSIAAALETPPHGTRPFMVVGVAGNCRTTGIDDLNALANLCEKHKVWFHVDACHGGSLLFSNRLRKQISGIERADSISLDPHKGLFVTYPSSYLLVRDPSKFAVFSRYADKVSNPNCMDLGLITPFYGSRGFDSLRLWAVIKHMGRAGISTLIESRQETFNQLRAMLENLGFFTMLGTSEFYRCAFVFCPKSVEMLISELITFPELRDSVRMIISLHTKQLCEQLYKSGEVVFDLFSLHDLRDVMGCGTKYKFDVMGMSVGHAAIDTVDQKKIAKQITILAEQQTKQLVDELVLLKDGIYPEVVMTTSSGPAGW
ncbi:MAG: pyridoxal-dependent decarboxylase, partial [Candidatus Thiodiazotropha sp.]